MDILTEKAAVCMVHRFFRLSGILYTHFSFSRLCAHYLDIEGNARCTRDHDFLELERLLLYCMLLHSDIHPKYPSDVSGFRRRTNSAWSANARLDCDYRLPLLFRRGTYGIPSAARKPRIRHRTAGEWALTDRLAIAGFPRPRLAMDGESTAWSR
jgi:hypothetical protein